MIQRNRLISKGGAKLALLGILALIITMPWQAAKADPYTDGEAKFRQRDYDGALASFNMALKQNPRNGNAMYYQGVCIEYKGDKRTAEKYYASCAQSFMGTQAGNLAMQALERLEPGSMAALRQATGGRMPTGAAGGGMGSSQSAASTSASHVQTYASSSSSSKSSNQGVSAFGTSSDLASLPDQATVPFTRNGGLLIIRATLNHHDCEMVFDTGADACVFGKNQLQEFNIRAPQGKANGQAGGVGSSSGIDYWVMQTDLKVGQIERHNFPIIVHETMSSPPLLGQSFFRNFEYTIDYMGAEKDHGEIRFSKKGTSASNVGSGYTVPFTRMGNEMIVTAEVNGKSCQMFFDTGATNISFTESQLKDLGIPIPDDAVLEQHSGAAGSTFAKGFSMNRIRLGPIEKTNIMVSALSQANMPHPLLGQTFFGGWQYTIDNDHSVIRFVRR